MDTAGDNNPVADQGTNPLANQDSSPYWAVDNNPVADQGSSPSHRRFIDMAEGTNSLLHRLIGDCSDTWNVIGEKLDWKDRIWLRAVCKKFRSYVPFRTLPKLMYAGHPGNNSAAREIYSMGIIEVEDDGSVPFMFGEIKDADIIGSLGSWVIASSKSRSGKSIRIRLFHVVNRKLLSFPPLLKPSCLSLKKMILSVDSRPFVAVGICWSSLVVGSVDGAKWRICKTDPVKLLHDVIFYNNVVYAVSHCGRRIVTLDPGNQADDAAVIIQMSGYDVTGTIREHYLVESNGELLMIVKLLPEETFTLYQVDLSEKKLKKLLPKDLKKNRAFFIGSNGSVSVDVNEFMYFGSHFPQGEASYTVRDNCIYFTTRGSINLGYNVGVYDIALQRIVRYHRETFNPLKPYIWLV